MYITYTYNSEYSILTIFDTYILKTVEDVFYGTKGLNSIVLIDFRSPWPHKKNFHFFWNLSKKDSNLQRLLFTTHFNTMRWKCFSMIFRILGSLSMIPIKVISYILHIYIFMIIPYTNTFANTTYLHIHMLCLKYYIYVHQGFVLLNFYCNKNAIIANI